MRKNSSIMGLLLASLALGSPAGMRFSEPTLKSNPDLYNKSNEKTQFDLERMAEADARREIKRLKKQKK